MRLILLSFLFLSTLSVFGQQTSWIFGPTAQMEGFRAKLNKEVLWQGTLHLEEEFMIMQVDGNPAQVFRGSEILVDSSRTFKIDRVFRNDPLTGSTYYLNRLQLQRAHEITEGDASVVVAVIDTGIDYEYPELMNQLWTNKDEIPGNGIDDDQNGFIDDLIGYDFVDSKLTAPPGDSFKADSDPMDEEGHGSEMSAVIAGEKDNDFGLYGVAPSCKIMTLRSFNSAGFGEIGDIAQSIVYAVNNGADIINMSFSDTYRSKILEAVLEWAEKKGVVAVGSAGNVGGPFTRFPAGYQHVIAVSWTNVQDQLTVLSSYGPHLTLSAPGSDIPVPNINAEQDVYVDVSGSSLSAAMISGVAALVKSLHPDLSAKQIRRILTRSTDDVSYEGWDQWTGAGRVNALRALQEASGGMARITSVSVAEDTLSVFGTAFHHLANAYQIDLANGLREPLNFTTRIQVNETRIDTLLANILIEDLNNGDYTLRLRLEAEAELKLEDRYLITVDRDSLFSQHFFAVPGFHANRPSTFVFSEVNKPTASTLIGTYPASGEKVYLYDRIGRQSLFNLDIYSESQQHISLFHKELATKKQLRSEHLIATNTKSVMPLGYEETQTNEISTWNSIFHLPERRSFLRVSRQFSPSGFQLRFYDPNNTSDFSIADIPTNAFPRAFADIDGDGFEEVLLQFGNQLLVAKLDENFQTGEILFGEEQENLGWGSGMFDLDSDGFFEVWGHNRSTWLGYEWDGSAFNAVASLDNPSSFDGNVPISGNEFTRPLLRQAGDLLIAGDFDGDLISIKANGQGGFATEALIESNLSAAGEIIETYRQGSSTYVVWATAPFQGVTDEREVNPEFCLLQSAELIGDSLVIADSLVLDQVVLSDASSGLDSLNGANRLWISSPPHMWGITLNLGEFGTLEYYSDQNRSQQIGAINGKVWFTPDDKTVQLELASSQQLDYPIEVLKASSNQSNTYLALNLGFSPDSISVESDNFRRSISGNNSNNLKIIDLNTVISDSLEVSFWVQGALAADSTILADSVASGQIEKVQILDSNTLSVQTSEPFLSEHRPMISFVSNTSSKIERVQMWSVSPTQAVVQFRSNVYDFSSLEISDFFSESYSPFQVFALSVSAPEEFSKFVVESSEIVSDQSFVLQFSAPIDASSLSNMSARLFPAGEIANAEIADSPNRLEFFVEGSSLLYSGKEHNVQLSGLLSVDAEPLNSTLSGYISLSTVPTDIEFFRPYPNPWKFTESDQVFFSNIPRGSDLRIYSIDGILVYRRLIESDGLITWDGRNSGSRVGTGVYLVILRFQNRQTIKKLVIINNG